jgi:hypothetical protein
MGSANQPIQMKRVKMDDQFFSLEVFLEDGVESFFQCRPPRLALERPSSIQGETISIQEFSNGRSRLRIPNVHFLKRRSVIKPIQFYSAS